MAYIWLTDRFQTDPIDSLRERRNPGQTSPIRNPSPGRIGYPQSFHGGFDDRSAQDAIGRGLAREKIEPERSRR
jgi:hypothetical protein